MSKMSIRNKHLKETINYAKVYLDDGEDTPVDLFFELVNELKVSNLIIPLSENSDGVFFENIIFEEEDKTFIPLFTDIDEYTQYVDEVSEFEPASLQFSQYVDLVEEGNLDGIIINIETQYLPLEKEFLKNIYFEVEDNTDDDDEEAFTAPELKEILDNLNNGDLIELLTSDEKFTTDELFAELSYSTVLNLVVSDKPLDEFAENGIIKSDDVGGFDLCNLEYGDILLAGIFTDLDAVNQLTESIEGYCYVQITRLTDLFEFVLRNDMDGVMINPNSLDCIIMRADFLSQASGIEVIMENSKFRNCLDYAFVI